MAKRVSNKKVYGFGINDVEYPVTKWDIVRYREDGSPVKGRVWICPFYDKWSGMLERCYSEAFHKDWPSYKDCYAVTAWSSLSTFRSWMEKQDWQGKHLDKDLLFPGNKEYGPETCMFVDAKVNTFLTEAVQNRGLCPIGVRYRKDNKKFTAQCCSVVTGKQEYLGQFLNQEDAFLAWLDFKTEQAKILADQQTDERISKALIQRYQNYEYQINS